MFHVIRTLFELFTHSKKLHFFVPSSPKASENSAQVSLAFLPHFTQNLTLMGCSKNLSLDM